MQTSPQIRLRSVILGLVVGLAFLAGLTFTGIAVGFESPVSLLAVVIVGVLLGTFRLGSVFDRNAGQVVASALTAGLPAIVLVLPILLLEDPGLPWTVAVSLLAGSALAGVLFMAAWRKVLLVREGLPFPSSVAIARTIQGTRGRGRFAFWLGLIVGLASFLLIGGLAPVSAEQGRDLLLSRTWTRWLELDAWRNWSEGRMWRLPGVPPRSLGGPLWGLPTVWSFDLGAQWGWTTPAVFSVAGSVAVLALGFFIGTPGVLLAFAVLVVQWVLVPFGSFHWNVEARAFSTRVGLPLGTALLVGGSVGTLLLGTWPRLRRDPGTHRYRVSGGGARIALWCLGLLLAASALFFAVRTQLGRAGESAVLTRREESTSQLTLVTAGARGSSGGDVFRLGGRLPVHATHLVADAPLSTFLRRQAVEREVDLGDGRSLNVRFFPSDVPAENLVLRPGRHFEANLEGLQYGTTFELVASGPGRLLATKDLQVIVRRVVTSFPVGPADFVRPFVDVPLPEPLPQDVRFFIPKERTPAECFAGQPVEKWWRCIAGRKVPASIVVELQMDEGLPEETRLGGGRVRETPGLQARIDGVRGGKRVRLHVQDVGPEHVLWSPTPVPANAEVGTPAFVLRLGPGRLPAGELTTRMHSALVFDPSLGYVPLGDGNIWETAGLELGVLYEVERFSLESRTRNELRVDLPLDPERPSDKVEVSLSGAFGGASPGIHVDANAFIPPPVGLTWQLSGAAGRKVTVGREGFELRLSWQGREARVLVPAGYVPFAPLKPSDPSFFDAIRHGARLALGPGSVGEDPSRADSALLFVTIPGLAWQVESGDPERIMIHDMQWAAGDRELLRRALENPAHVGLVVRDATGNEIHVPLHENAFGGRRGEVISHPVLITEEGVFPLRVEGPEAGTLRLTVQAPAGPLQVDVAEGVLPGSRVDLGDGYAIVLPPAFASGPDPRSTPWFALALLGAILVATWLGIRVAGWFEGLSWIITGACALCALAPFVPSFVVGTPSPVSVPLLLALAAVLTAVGAAVDTGRDLRVAQAIGARANGIVALKVVFCSAGVAAGFFLVQWLATHADTGLGGTALPAVRASLWLQELRTAVGTEPSWTLLGGGAVVGGLAATTAIAGLPVWLAAAFFLPMGFAMTFGTGALLRVVAQRSIGRRFVERTGFSFFTGLMLGELLLGIALAAALAAFRLQAYIG